MGRTDFSDQFRKITIRHKRISYNLNAIRQSVCLVINLITVVNLSRAMVLSRAMSPLYEVLHSGHMSFTHIHGSCRRGRGMEEQAAALELLPGGFHMRCRCKFTSTIRREHVPK